MKIMLATTIVLLVMLLAGCLYCVLVSVRHAAEIERHTQEINSLSRSLSDLRLEVRFGKDPRELSDEP